MCMYRVIRSFTDLQDNNYSYNVGDTFPHDGKNVGEERFAELASYKNKQGRPLIEAVDETVATVTAEDAAENTEEKPKRRRKAD